MTQEKQWLNDRLGYFTASQIYRLLTTERGGSGFGQTAMTYIMEIVAEMLTGEGKAQVSSKSIEWGNDHEAEAMDMYIDGTGRKAMYFGKENPVFFPINDLPAGGSPDGLIENKRVIELKCPYDTANHIENCIMTLEEFKKNRKEYYAQVQLNMIATNVMTADFCSYDPRIIDEDRRLSILEVSYDRLFCDNMMDRIREAANIRDRIYRTVLMKKAA